MSHVPLISVIVPVYKVEEYLERCVRSLTGQTYENLEIILVDDGSPDKSGELCDALAQQDPRIRVIHKENGGLSDARNAGIDIARGDYLAFVDSDDWVEPDSYRVLLETALSQGVELVCGGRYDYNAETGEKKTGLCPRKKEVISGVEFTRRLLVWDQIDSSACDKLYAKRLFRSVRYPYGVTSEDVPVTYRIALDAGRIALVDMPFYNYFHRSESITTANISEKNFQALDHSQQIIRHLRQEYPQLLPQARYFRLSNLTYMLLRLEQGGKQTLRQNKQRHAAIKKEVRRNAWFILTSPLVRLKKKLLWLILGMGAYDPLRKVYHGFR